MCGTDTDQSYKASAEPPSRQRKVGTVPPTDRVEGAPVMYEFDEAMVRA